MKSRTYFEPMREREPLSVMPILAFEAHHTNASRSEQDTCACTLHTKNTRQVHLAIRAFRIGWLC